MNFLACVIGKKGKRNSHPLARTRSVRQVASDSDVWQGVRLVVSVLYITHKEKKETRN
uniref:Uncharacterized protein n=1 Tax=Rhizophora mucronata TaxID=61149 RepID=A0A2P2J5R9_RHIMU